MELRNYRKFRQSAVEFPDGVIGVIGPNGVGKSTLIEAISWAIYGNDAQRTRREDVRWNGASPGEVCSVILEFDLDGDRYRVHRQMRGSDLKMRVNLEVNGKLHADGDRAVTQVLSQRIGMDYKAFFISVFARQKDLDALSVLPPGERKQLILRMLDIDVLDRIVSSIRSDRSGLETQIKAVAGILVNGEGRERSSLLGDEIEGIELKLAEHEKELKTLHGEKDRLEAKLSRLKEEKDLLDSKEKEYHDIQIELAGSRSSVEGLRGKMDSLERERTSLERLRVEMESLKEKSDLLERLLSEREKLERIRESRRERDSLQSRIDLLEGTLPDLKSEIGECAESISRMGDPSSSMETVNKSLRDAEDSLDAMRGDLSDIGAEIRAKVRERDEVLSKRKDIIDLGPESSCPTCERRLGEQHQFLLDKMSREIEGIEGDILRMKQGRSKKEKSLQKEAKRRDVLSNRLDGLRESRVRLAELRESLKGRETRLKEIEMEIDDLRSHLDEMEDVVFDEKGYHEIRAMIDELRAPARRYAEVCGRLERLPEVSDEVLRTSRSIAELNESIGSLEKRLEFLEFDEERLRSVRESSDAILSAREEIATHISSLTGEMRLQEGRMESVVREMESLEESAKVKRKWENEVASLSTLGDLMNDFRSNLISRIVPTLSEISSSLFNEMTDSRYGSMEIDSDYNISIFDGNRTYGLERFSGGENDLANLCLRLAISRVIADRSGSSVDFLILDEIFGSQDQSRKRNIMSTLNRLSNRFKQIVLITHIDDVKEFMGEVIYVKELDDGSSQLVLET